MYTLFVWSVKYNRKNLFIFVVSFCDDKYNEIIKNKNNEKKKQVQADLYRYNCLPIDLCVWLNSVHTILHIRACCPKINLRKVFTQINITDKCVHIIHNWRNLYISPDVLKKMKIISLSTFLCLIHTWSS